MLTDDNTNSPEVTGNMRGFNIIHAIKEEQTGFPIPPNYACLRDWDQTCVFPDCHRRSVWKSQSWFNGWIDYCSDFMKENKEEFPEDLI